MIDTNNENKKLARIQRDLLLPAQTNEDNVDVVIKIRNGVIVWAETMSVIKVRVDFKEIFNI